MLFLSLLLLPSLFSVVLAEGHPINREDVDGTLGSSVLLDPKVKVDDNKTEIIWEFIPVNGSAVTILHHIPDVGFEEPNDNFQSRLQYTPSNASLMVKGLGHGDQGEYRLTINDQVVKIIQLFLFVNREDVDGALGSSVLLDPKVKVEDNKTEIIWEFIPVNGNAVTILHHIPDVGFEEPNDNFQSRLQYTPSNASLMVKGLGHGDQGEYRLTIDDQVVKIIQLFLFVNREDVDGTLGSSVLLDPKVKVEDNKAEIIWEFIPVNGSAVTILHHIPDVGLKEPNDDFKPRVQYTPSNASLMVNGLRLEEQGEYRLTIDDQVVKIIQLHLFDELTEALISTNSSSLGSTIQLTCNVSGNVDEYQWWKDGREISRHHQLIDQNRSLVIPGASRRDCGTYTCVAINPVSRIQKNYTLIIHGFPSLELAIIILSIVDVLMYSASLIACLYLHCWKMKLDKDMKRIKRWLPALPTCNIVAMFVAILASIAIQGAGPVLKAGLCSVLAQILVLCLPFAAPIIDKLSMNRHQKIRFSDLIVCGLQVIVMAISITFLTMVIHQNSCDSSRTTWGIFFTSRIGCVGIFIVHTVFLHCKGKDTSGNMDTDKEQKNITELQQLNTTTPDHTADPGSLPPD